ncbi:hypothetical protein [Rufibacter ruber]|uniref:hypothetical protein n=1 Tax=Rufibacter ruber TaxID=1783499 RepID=UPI00129056E3|nr:hypothetical protein [Rufibacter ruber]
MVNHQGFFVFGLFWPKQAKTDNIKLAAGQFFWLYRHIYQSARIFLLQTETDSNPVANAVAVVACGKAPAPVSPHPPRSMNLFVILHSQNLT